MPMNQKQWIRELTQHGWSVTKGGKHAVKMAKAGERPITLPRHKGATYGSGLDRDIRRQAGLG